MLPSFVRSLKVCRLLSTAASTNAHPELLFTNEVGLLSNARASPSGAGHNTIRASTAAVATRLSQQTQFPLLPGTPFSLEGALHTNPFNHARIITTKGDGPATLYCNDQWVKMMGYTLDEVKGKCAVQALIGEWTDPKTVQKISEAFCSGRRLRTTIMTAKKDGTPFMMHLQITPLLCKNGKSTHSLAVVHTVV